MASTCGVVTELVATACIVRVSTHRTSWPLDSVLSRSRVKCNPFDITLGWSLTFPCLASDVCQHASGGCPFFFFSGLHRIGIEKFGRIVTQKHFAHFRILLLVLSPCTSRGFFSPVSSTKTRFSGCGSTLRISCCPRGTRSTSDWFLTTTLHPPRNHFWCA